MAEEKESIGRVEVAPEVLTTIVRFTILGVEGVAKLASGPSDMGHLFRRSTRHDGVVLHYSEGKASFDVYVLMEPDVNILQTSRALQAAIIEAIDTMVGIPVSAVNVHVEDVIYEQGEVV